MRELWWGAAEAQTFLDHEGLVPNELKMPGGWRLAHIWDWNTFIIPCKITSTFLNEWYIINISNMYNYHVFEMVYMYGIFIWDWYSFNGPGMFVPYLDLVDFCCA